ncbi:hypothetical protein CANCADRAFT_44722 [Tortispora caseinolytica NRRL Y-17796]|uniref:Uncharacterized protein n=1 Tax=Tortispora caseinolytica NRRL Y-17796 TaxID=767744 RepID=A0A1E4TH73_9ASCO|nr:hypothetical protein CANCADRAFT_44722 [Tortispora caseinolytica NRRL Y-17796]
MSSYFVEHHGLSYTQTLAAASQRLLSDSEQSTDIGIELDVVSDYSDTTLSESSIILPCDLKAAISSLPEASATYIGIRMARFPAELIISIARYLPAAIVDIAYRRTTNQLIQSSLSCPSIWQNLAGRFYAWDQYQIALASARYRTAPLPSFFNCKFIDCFDYITHKGSISYVTPGLRPLDGMDNLYLLPHPGTYCDITEDQCQCRMNFTIPVSNRLHRERQILGWIFSAAEKAQEFARFRYVTAGLNRRMLHKRAEKILDTTYLCRTIALYPLEMKEFLEGYVPDRMKTDKHAATTGSPREHTVQRIMRTVYSYSFALIGYYMLFPDDRLVSRSARHVKTPSLPCVISWALWIGSVRSQCPNMLNWLWYNGECYFNLFFNPIANEARNDLYFSYVAGHPSSELEIVERASLIGDVLEDFMSKHAHKFSNILLYPMCSILVFTAYACIFAKLLKIIAIPYLTPSKDIFVGLYYIQNSADLTEEKFLQLSVSENNAACYLSFFPRIDTYCCRLTETMPHRVDSTPFNIHNEVWMNVIRGSINPHCLETVRKVIEARLSALSFFENAAF